MNVMPMNKRISIETNNGLLTCELHEEAAYPGLTILWNERQIAIVEASPGTSIMRVMTWDTDKEDPSTVIPIFPGYGE